MFTGYFLAFRWTRLRYTPGLDGKLARKRERLSGLVGGNCSGGKKIGVCEACGGKGSEGG